MDEVRTIVGLVASDTASPSGRARRRYRDEPKRRVRADSIARAVATANALGTGVVQDFQRARSELLEELKRDPEMHKALAEQLRKDFEANVQQSHDFLQLVKLVRGHVEVLLSEKHPDLAPPDAADRLPTEGAIYYSTELMLVKMDSLTYLNEINQAIGQESRFQIHPFVLKYVRIYRWQAMQKEIDLVVEGDCRVYCRYNSKAIGAVVQGLLDNLVKYAPASSVAKIRLLEDADGATIEFVSLGPRIEDDERSSIFLPGFRAEAARTMEGGGQGVGLAAAKNVSDALLLDLAVEQHETEDPNFPGRHQTTFSFRIGKASRRR